MRRILNILPLLIFYSVTGLAQTTPEYKKYKAFFPKEAAVVIKKVDEVSIEIVGKGLSITTNNYHEQILLDNRAGQFSEYSFTYDDFRELIDIQASTLSPQKNGYKEIKVKDFKTTDNLSKSVFYDGSKKVYFFYPSLEEGAKTILKSKQKISHPQFMPGFYCQTGIPVIEAVYSITAPEEVEIGWKHFNLADSMVTMTKVKNKNKVVYTWVVKNMKAFNDEPNSLNSLYSLSHVITWIKSYKVDGKIEPVLGSPDDLYNWYAQISEKSNEEHSDELKAVVDSLTRNSNTELEKVKNIYYWVQDHIRYIAIEDGMGGFVPRSGKLVYERRYGDCKDMASIITKMLSYAEIPSFLTWIGSRDLPYRYEELPTPNVDNHMIATYIHEGNYYFLDATGTYTPFDIPTSFIQGKEAMIGKSKGKYEIFEVPIIPKEKSKVIDTVVVDIVGNKLIGKGNVSYSGYNRIDMVSLLSHHNVDKDKFLKDELYKGSNKFLIDSYKISGLDDRDQVLNLEYEFNIQDYLNNYSGEIFVNLNLNKDFFMEEILKERSLDIKNDHKETISNYFQLNIPEGYQLSQLPSRHSFADEKFGFDIFYEMENDKIVLHQEVYYNFLTLKKKDFEQYNKMVKSLKKAYSEVLVLEKKKQTP